MAQYLETLETSRLILRGLDETDTENVVKWRSDPEVYLFFKNPHAITKDEHLNWFRNSYLLNSNRCDWMCIEKSTGTKVGVFGLCKDIQVAEINYLLAPGFKHKGFATEAVSALVHYSKERWNSKEMIAEIHKNNLASIIFIERLGFMLKTEHDSFFIYHKEV